MDCLDRPINATMDVSQANICKRIIRDLCAGLAHNEGIKKAEDLLRAAVVKLAEGLSFLAANYISALSDLDAILTSAESLTHTDSFRTCYDELRRELEATEVVKKVAIETELVSLDEVLECCMQLSNFIASLESTSDGDVVREFAGQQAALAQISTVLESLHLAGGPCSDAVLYIRHVDASSFDRQQLGCIIVSHLAASDDVEVDLTSTLKWLRPGSAVCFTVRFKPQARKQAAFDATTANSELAARTRVVAVFQECGEGSSAGAPLEFSVKCLEEEGAGVMCSTILPMSAPSGSAVRIVSVRVGGAHVSPLVWPLDIPVPAIHGLDAPAVYPEAMRGMMNGPCVSPMGELFLPCNDEVLVKGSRTAKFAVSDRVFASAFDPISQTLLLGSLNGSFYLVAHEPDSFRVKWQALPSTRDGGIRGIAVLPSHGVCFACSPNRLWALRIADGKEISSVSLQGSLYLAADERSAMVFASSNRDGHEVMAFQWDSAVLQPKGQVEAAGLTRNNRVLACMPPAPGKMFSYLIVGTCHNLSSVMVIRLPDLTCIHTHEFIQSTCLYGMAADVTGTALVVVESERHTAEVLLWPLPGMPPLE